MLRSFVSSLSSRHHVCGIRTSSGLSILLLSSTFLTFVSLTILSCFPSFSTLRGSVFPRSLPHPPPPPFFILHVSTAIDIGEENSGGYMAVATTPMWITTLLRGELYLLSRPPPSFTHCIIRNSTTSFVPVRLPLDHGAVSSHSNTGTVNKPREKCQVDATNGEH